MPVSPADAAHLLRRTGFGVVPARLGELTRLSTRNAAVDRVLDTSLNPSATLPIGTGAPADPARAWWQLTEWWLERMRTSPSPIVEKLTLFWHGHFVSGTGKGVDVGLLAQQNATLRSNALGNLHTLAQAVSVDPAMLYYLDNMYNHSFQPQENFGRELMELFTLGVGQYSQADVRAMTRAWTGHSVDDATYRSYHFRSAWHDTGSSSLFGTTARSWNGPAALTEVLKGSKAVAASRFITAKLFSYLAYPVTVSDGNVITLADRFRTNLDIKALVRAILRSTAFWSPKARRALVRTPTEYFVAGMQAMDLPASVAVPQWWMDRSGQALFNPPDVSGWKQNAYWLSTSGMWGRSGWAAHVRYAAYDAGLFRGIESASASTAVSTAFDRFGITEPSPTTRAALEAWFDKAKADGDSWSIPGNLTMLMLLSPDFQVA